MTKRIAYLSPILFLALPAFAQQECRVLDPQLQGSYQGRASTALPRAGASPTAARGMKASSRSGASTAKG